MAPEVKYGTWKTNFRSSSGLAADGQQVRAPWGRARAPGLTPGAAGSAAGGLRVEPAREGGTPRRAPGRARSPGRPPAGSPSPGARRRPSWGQGCGRGRPGGGTGLRWGECGPRGPRGVGRGFLPAPAPRGPARRLLPGAPWPRGAPRFPASAVAGVATPSSPRPRSAVSAAPGGLRRDPRAAPALCAARPRPPGGPSLRAPPHSLPQGRRRAPLLARPFRAWPPRRRLGRAGLRITRAAGCAQSAVFPRPSRVRPGPRVAASPRPGGPGRAWPGSPTGRSVCAAPGRWLPGPPDWGGGWCGGRQLGDPVLAAKPFLSPAHTHRGTWRHRWGPGN